MLTLLLYFVVVLFHLASCHPRVRNVGIYGGHSISIEEAPYMASQRVEQFGKWIHKCGATIIHERFILTAAHCTQYDTPGSIKIIVGTDKKDGRNGIIFDVEKIWIHSGWVGDISSGNDISLIKLKKPVTFGPKVNKITLASDSLILPNKTKLNATGWGRIEGHIKGEKLLQVALPLISHAECDKIFGDISDGMICAGDRGLDTCQGDSGGPLNFEDVQVGITSNGRGCGRLPGIYTKVSAYHSWITERMSPYEL